MNQRLSRIAPLFLVLPLYLAGCGAAPTEIEGTWLKACVASSGTSTKTTLTNTGDTGVLAGESFSDAACTTLAATTTVTSTFTLGAAVDSPAGAKKMDSTLVSITITPKTDAMVTTLNTGSYCSVTNWAKDTATDVTGKVCSGGVTYFAKGAVTYTLYKLEGSSLTLGTTTGLGPDDGTTEAGRHTALDSVSYTKQ